MSKTGPKTKIIHTPSPTTAAKPKPTTTYDASVMEASADWSYNTHPSTNTNDYQNEIYVDNRPAKNYHNSQTSTIHNNQVPTMSNQMSYDTVLNSKNEITSMVLQYMSSWKWIYPCTYGNICTVYKMFLRSTTKTLATFTIASPVLGLKNKILEL
jgi:hypothetical protein